MKRLALLIALFGFLVGAGFGQSTHAEGFYFHPQLGAAIPINSTGDTGISAGAAVGYQFLSYLAAEMSYNYLWQSDYQGHVFRFGPVLSYSLEIITPYITAGGGFHKFEINDVWQGFSPLLYMGGGVSLDLLGPFALSGGVNYDILDNGPDFVTPYLTLSFIL